MIAAIQKMAMSCYKALLQTVITVSRYACADFEHFKKYFYVTMSLFKYLGF